MLQFGPGISNSFRLFTFFKSFERNFHSCIKITSYPSHMVVGGSLGRHGVDWYWLRAYVHRYNRLSVHSSISQFFCLYIREFTLGFQAGKTEQTELLNDSLKKVILYQLPLPFHIILTYHATMIKCNFFFARSRMFKTCSIKFHQNLRLENTPVMEAEFWWVILYFSKHSFIENMAHCCLKSVKSYLVGPSFFLKILYHPLTTFYAHHRDPHYSTVV